MTLVMLKTAKVPKEIESIFEEAQEKVAHYFSEKIEDPSKGTISIFGERYILVRAASMSVDFIETVKHLYRDQGEEKSFEVARQLLFDLAHALGKTDARAFHERMDLKDPLEKLSAGPILFSYSGWAFVDILPESKPTPDENFCIVYNHPYSFESESWIKANKTSQVPVCIMNAGYSSGWCEESFGVTLVASEIMCKAKTASDSACRFIMAHPSKIEDYIQDYLKKETKQTRDVSEYEIPGFFKRKQIEEERNRTEAQLKHEKLHLEYMNKFMVGRELDMVELKKEVDSLLKELGRESKYGY